MKLPFNRYLAPKNCYSLCNGISPWASRMFFILFIYGFVAGFFVSPSDYQQGDAFRIIYLHVPSAFLSLSVYSIMASCALIAWIWQVKVMHLIVKCCAPIGMSFTLLALITGAIWGKPMWGTWWVWDARLTSELLLFFLYFGVIAIGSVFHDENKANKASSLLAIIGVVNLPIIHYSVDWWFTLHQGRTVGLLNPKIDASMIYPLYAMIAAFVMYFIWILTKNICSELLIRERKTNWVKELMSC